MQNKHIEFMSQAIALSQESINNGGGPFAAVVVQNNKVVAAASNSVTKTNDPTAHAEVNAIREACRKLKTFDLADCTIYTSCEPCPMCLGAIYWARVSKVYYANTKSDAKAIGFDDSFIYDELELPIEKRKIEFERILPNEALKVFKNWDAMDNKIEY